MDKTIGVFRLQAEFRRAVEPTIMADKTGTMILSNPPLGFDWKTYNPSPPAADDDGESSPADDPDAIKPGCDYFGNCGGCVEVDIWNRTVMADQETFFNVVTY